MYDRILVPTDGSDAAGRALDLGVAAARAHDATVHVLYVADTNQPSLSRIEGQVVDVLETEGERVVESAADRARAAGVAVETEIVQGGVARTVLESVDERDIDLVVMGRRGLGNVKRLLLGSVTGRVVRESPVPVVVVPPGEDGDAGDDIGSRYPPESVAVGVDGTEASDAALDEAAALAAGHGATLHLVCVLEESLLGIDVRSVTAADQREERAEDLLADARERSEAAGATDVTTAVEQGDVVETLSTCARDRAVGLLAVGAHGRTGIDRHVLGSTTADLLRTADIPVLTVRAVESE